MSPIPVVLLKSNHKSQYSVTTLNVKPTLFPFIVNNLGNYRYTVLLLKSLTKSLFIQILIIRDNISSQLLIREARIFTNGYTHPSPMTIFAQLFGRIVIQKVAIAT